MTKVFKTILHSAKTYTIVLIFLLTTVFYLVSVSGLERDVINPDGINWHTRTNNFVEALLKRHYSDAYQVYHPGITLMWISSPALYSLGNYYQSIGEPWYSKRTFLQYDYVAKLSVVIVSTVLFFISLLLIHKALNIQALLIFSTLVIFEPFMIGERRLYHLDYLMTYFLFDAFLCFFVYFYKSMKLQYLMFGCFLYVLSVLTKSSTIVFLPFPLMMGFFSREKLWKRLISLPIFIVFIGLFLYIAFPPIWNAPQKNIPKFYQKIVTGLNDIGYQGKKELGFSGAQKNITLDVTYKQQPWDFYLNVLAFKLSVTTWILAAASIITLFIKGLIFVYKSLVELVKAVKATANKKLHLFSTNKNQNAWLTIYAFLIIDVFFTAFTIANKKGDRYAIVMVPFIFLIISQALSNINKKLAIVLSLIIVISLLPQLLYIYPYYYAYGNPILGGVRAKYETIDDAPFGVAMKQVSEYIKEDRMGNNALYTIAGPKSLKAISDGAKSTKTPNCTTDYFVAFVLSDQPDVLCSSQRYSIVATVKVGNMNYWYIYKQNRTPNIKDAIIDTSDDQNDQ